MSDIKMHYYLWGIWLLWGGGIISHIIFESAPVFIYIGALACLIALIINPILLSERMVRSVFNFKSKLNQTDNDSLPLGSHHNSGDVLIEKIIDANVNKDTIISPGTLLCGEITNESNITVNGCVEGSLASQKITQIGREGKVIGKVNSLKVVVNGFIKGSCHAKSVTILSQGRVEGDIFSRELSIEKGGVFIGNSHQIDESDPQIKPENIKERAGHNMYSAAISPPRHSAEQAEPASVKKQ